MKITWPGETSEKSNENETTSSNSLLEAPYMAKTKEPFTTGDESLRPCILDVVQEILGPEATKELEAILLLEAIFQWRVVDRYWKASREEMKSRCFAIQLDESTDIMLFEV